MTRTQLARRTKRSALALALGLCFAGGVQAQSNTSGAIVGNADPGDAISVTSEATGYSRTISASADGSFRFSALPPGTYQVSEAGGSPRTVTVSVGTASTVERVRRK